jgi:hypothetical protein
VSVWQNLPVTVERLAVAVSLAREVNDRIALMDWADAENDKLQFLCECGATDCVGVVSLTLSEYGVLRHRGPIVMDGHSAE